MLSFLGNDILTVNRKKNKVLAEAHRIIKEVKPMNYLERSRRLAPTVFAADMARVVASWTDVPVSIAGRDEAKVLLNLEDKLRERVIGQNDAITSLSKALRRSRMGLSDPNRPIASFLFCGPTGVGKTEITKALAQEFFGSEQNMVRLDMSEYMERHTTSKLIGAPPGYIGYNEGGQLTEAVRRTPYTVVLFDEVEKAHPDIFNLLLQVLDDGRLTDASNRTIDFTNTVVIMTSNLGAVDIQSYVAENISPERTLTSKENEKIKIELKELVQVSLRGFFRPEFLNRLDEIVVFQPLSTDSVSKIAHKLLSALKKRIRKKGYLLVITPPAHEEIVREGYDPLNGARPLRRVITNRIEDNIANLLLENPLLPETSIFVHLDDNGKIAIAYLDQEDVRRVTAQESARRLKEENKSKNSLY
jgi:ATP-dependent Clp protease ATP-binding subunit ClpC